MHKSPFFLCFQFFDHRGNTIAEQLRGRDWHIQFDTRLSVGATRASACCSQRGSGAVMLKNVAGEIQRGYAGDAQIPALSMLSIF
jgi:hypothetical protein